MKKILIFFTVLTALLIFQPDLFAVAQCELEVTAGSTNPTVDWDPCVVISRSGIREGDIWIPQDDNKYCQDFSMQATKNNKSGVYSDDVYFECKQQKAAAQCTMDFIAARKDDCWVGQHDGYSTKLVMFQMDYVVTPMLHFNYGAASDVAEVTEHIPVKLEESFTLNLVPNEQYVYSDARSFWNGYNDTYVCLGSACGDSVEDDSVWGHNLIYDLGDHKGSAVMSPATFNQGQDTTILSVPEYNGTKQPGTVPITVDVQDGQYAITVNGPEELKDGQKRPRLIIRGWNVQMLSGAGLIKTTGHVDLIFRRTIIQMKPTSSSDATGFLNLSPHTTLNYSAVDIVTNNVVSFVTGGEVAKLSKEEGLEIDMGGSSYEPIVFTGMPEKYTLQTMGSGMYLSFNFSADVAPAPLKIMGISSYETECVAKTIGECLTSLGVDEVLVFSPVGGYGSHYNIEYFDGEFNFDATNAYIYVIDGNDAGAQVVFTDELEFADVAPEEATAVTEVAPEEETKEVEDVEDVAEPEEDSYTPPPPTANPSCPDGEYWSAHFQECKVKGSVNSKGSSSTATYDVGNDSESATADEESYPVYISGAPSDEELIIAEEDTGADDDSSSPTEFAMTSAGNGCSLVSSASPECSIQLLFLAIALAGLTIRRKTLR